MCYMAVPVYTVKMRAWLTLDLYSVTVAVRKKVSTDHLYETTYRGKNDHVADDVT